ASNFTGAGRALHPAAAMREGVPLGDAAHQQDNFGQHQFRHAARVRERRVKDRNAAILRRLEVDLVGADAETADAGELWRLVEQFGGEMGGGTDADEIRIAQGGGELLPGQRFLVILDLRVAVGAKRLYRALMDSFE